MTVEKYFTPREAANLLGFHYETIRSMVKGGELGALKFGRRVRIPESELQKWIENNATSAAEPGIFHRPKQP